MMDREYTEAWARETIRLFEEQIRKKRIRQSGKLEGSFKYEIETFANGDIKKIKILYNYYGKFVNLGVGKGQKYDDVKDNKVLNQLSGKKGRRAKKWKDSVWRKQRQKIYGDAFLEMRKRSRKALKLKQKVKMNF